MEELPHEILLEILRMLPFHDVRSFRSTCRRLYDLLPTTISAFHVETLAIRDREDLPSSIVDFRLSVSPKIKNVKVNVALVSVEYGERLRAVLDACPNLQSLELESLDDRQEPAPGAQLPDSTYLHQFLSAVSFGEVHCGNVERDRVILLPRGVKRCTLNWLSLKEMFYSHHVGRSSEDSLLDSIESLHLVCNADFREAPHPVWGVLRQLRLNEFSLRGDFFPLFGMSTMINPPSTLGTIRKLALAVPVTDSTMKEIFRRCARVESLRLDLGQALKYRRTYAGLTYTGGYGYGFPSGLKELHIHGRLPKTTAPFSNWLFNLSHASSQLEVVTQDYEFDGDEMPSSIAPNIAFVGRLGRLKPGLFRDLYVYLQKGDDWRNLLQLLRPVLSLNHLYICTRFSTKSGKDADPISKASPEVTTTIARLTVDDGHAHDASSSNVLTSFVNVGEYSVRCHVQSQLFHTCRGLVREREDVATSTWRLRLLWNAQVSYAQLGEIVNVTHLTLENQSDEPIDLDQLCRVVGAKLKHLKIVGHVSDGHPSGIPCVRPTELDKCLHFPKLERVIISNLASEHHQTFSQELEGWKPLKTWPLQLREIVLVFERVESPVIFVENFGYVFKIRHSDNGDSMF